MLQYKCAASFLCTLLWGGQNVIHCMYRNLHCFISFRFLLVEGCDLERVVKRCPNNMTGADFYALCSDAMLTAMKNKIERLDAGEHIAM